MEQQLEYHPDNLYSLPLAGSSDSTDVQRNSKLLYLTLQKALSRANQRRKTGKLVSSYVAKMLPLESSAVRLSISPFKLHRMELNPLLWFYSVEIDEVQDEEAILEPD
ncbi:hypothetical protein IQ268_21560 [Oculatella sp. LEGE 06141]|uniref:hypothetical protein n=1 Tax=Oculatella sp. LEGE 06141 TaxID=1828648 RepID=UPI001882D6B8|nr:hypothetical protein [Oculatella sp. LEGE 06141]MBE9181152.1 hypothetical protein [Oculatella sp. LEGE 06141]